MPCNLCAATTLQGRPCARRATKGEKLCASHLGKAHRPTKLSEEVTHRVAGLLRNGNYVTTAMQACGLHPDSYYAWRERGEADQDAGIATEFSEFAEACARARAEGQAMLLQMVRASAVAGDWKAAAWILERTAPDLFGPHQEVKHSGAIRTDVPALPDDAAALNEVADILRAIGMLGGELDG